MNRTNIIISTFGIVGFAILFLGNYLAPRIWQKYRNPELTLLVDRTNAKLAQDIGNYYFGAPAYDLERAKAGFEKAIKIERGILWGHYQLARIYFVEKKFVGALEEINLELKYNPGNFRSLYVRGLIYGYTSQFSEAENDFKHFTLWVPKEWAGYNDLAWILGREGKYKEAEKVLKEALRVVPEADKNPWLLNSLGVMELNLGERASAKKNFLEAKKRAEKLTIQEWVRAYPGNNPEELVEALRAFRSAIDENLDKTRVDN